MKPSKSFITNLNSMLEIQTDHDSKQYNYTWVSMFEETLPYLDNIVRNPKRFIINEEEIVKVELSKKVTVESVIHLSQHTNLIQDYDEKKGDVKPSKILNINKDESLDTYENRFIYTLINNMINFYDQHAKKILGDAYYYDQKIARYEANTKIGNETIKMSLEFQALDKGIIRSADEIDVSIEDRLKKIKLQMDGFTNSELYQNLYHAHAPIVRSPIRKTNVILKNPNFQKAVDLWNYIQTFRDDDCVTEKDSKKIYDAGDIKNNFDQSFLLDYLSLYSLTQKENGISEKEAITMTLSRVIENILDMNDEVLEEKMKKIFTDEFKVAKDKVDQRNETILKILKEKMEHLNLEVQKASMQLE